MKLVKKTVTLLIVLTLVLSLFSCGCDEESSTEVEGYYQLGLAYSLPTSFQMNNYNYGDLSYDDGKGGYFFFSAFSGDEIEEDMHENPEISVREYTEIFKNLRAPIGTEYDYDEETDSAVLEYVIESDRNEYYRHMIIRGPLYLYQISMSCYEDDIDDYEEIFDKIIESIRTL